MRECQVHLHETSVRGAFEEFLWDGGEDDVAVVAPHGGAVEPNTDTQATLLGQAFPGSVVWGTRGIVDGGFNEAFGAWHTTSEDSELSDFPLFEEVRDREFETAVAFHATERDGVYLGGFLNQSEKEILAESLREFVDVEVTVVDWNDGPGMKEENFVNTLARDGGLHIEQGLDVVGEHPGVVVKAVAEWVRGCR